MEQNKLLCGNVFTVDSAATKTPTFRKLEDLNLIDNFLFQEMLTQKEDGEKFAKILLKTILGKPIRNVKIVPQKNIPGIDVDKHGIRLDAYIEEVVDDLNGEMAGAGYDKLPNVFIIFILPYDPFDKKRMVYTVQNRCIEDNTIPYDDGTRKIFL